MLKKRTIVAALATLVFAFGVATAADRDVASRKPVRGELEVGAQVQTAGPASVMQILRLRLIETLRLVKSLRQAETGSSGGYSFDGLSDGPDPIDAKQGGSDQMHDPQIASDEMPEVIPLDGQPADPYVNFGID